MELAALYAIAHLDPPDPALIARLALDGRVPSEEDRRALGDALDVWLYLEERELDEGDEGAA